MKPRSTRTRNARFMDDKPLAGQTIQANKDVKTASIATRGQMMMFLGGLAQGMSPFHAARHAGRPLAFWRSLARRDRVFGAAYEAACEDFGHAKAAESLEIVDKANEDKKASVSKARLQAEVRLRLAKAYASHTFGDKVDVTKRTVEVRRTEFVSYFGVRVMKQDEPTLEEVVQVLEANVVTRHEQVDDEEPAALGDGTPGPAPEPQRVPANEEGLRPDESDPTGQREEGDREREGREVGRRRLRGLAGDASEGE